jgi:hypothetical protein
MLQSLPAPLVLQSIQNKGKDELKFVVQNTATKLSSDFIITYSGGDIGALPVAVDCLVTVLKVDFILLAFSHIILQTFAPLIDCASETLELRCQYSHIKQTCFLTPSFSLHSDVYTYLSQVAKKQKSKVAVCKLYKSLNVELNQAPSTGWLNSNRDVGVAGLMKHRKSTSVDLMKKCRGL